VQKNSMFANSTKFTCRALHARAVPWQGCKLERRFGESLLLAASDCYARFNKTIRGQISRKDRP
jgi:hypothetical protein